MKGRPRTLLELVRVSADYLQRHGSKSPRLDAELLLAHATGLSRIDLYVQYDKPLEPAELERFRELVRRRAKGEPVAYLLGEREFRSLPFFVRPGVLVPRPETELLVEAAVAAVGDREGWVADVGTGSGIIAVCLALSCPRCSVVAIDCSAEALEVARANGARHGVGDRIEWVQGDLLEPVRSRRLLGIVSNPPYVPTGEWQRLDRDVRDFEPRVALDGGPDGLSVIRRLIWAAPAALLPGGFLALEIGAGQQDAVEALLREAGFGDIAWTRDYAGHPRVVVARRGPGLQREGGSSGSRPKDAAARR